MRDSKGFIIALLGFMIFHGLLYTADATVHRYTFVLQETNFTRLCSTKSMLTVNGSFPGPAIRVHEGDTVYVTVRNQGLYGVTIHWHGVKQPRNPWSDGPENITQCPILPNTSFTQKIIFSDEVGTLWWHAHSDWSRATVHGPIIILPKHRKSYPFKRPYAQQTIVLGEWYKGDVMELIQTALATGKDTNLSDAYTINGQPGDLYECSNTTTFRMKVKYGKTYMLRIISAVMNEEIFFGIANHSLTVVAQDAAYLKPVTVDYIMITPGQTMDVLVTANQTRSHYYMMASPFADTIALFDNSSATAIFQYRGKYTPPSTPSTPSLPAYNNKSAVGNFTNQLKSLASKEYPVNVPVNITERIFMTVAVNQLPCDGTCNGSDNKLAASLSNISFATPTIDILQAYYRNISGVYNSTFPVIPPYLFNFTGDVGNTSEYATEGTEVKLIEYGSTVEIIWQGTNIGAAENHPMHLHGFSYYVIGMGDGNFDNATSPATYNLVDPPLVNTVGLPKLGWTVIRFVADNPGVWFMHCHLERHSSWGMNMVIIVKDGPTNATSMTPPPSYMPPCST